LRAILNKPIRILSDLHFGHPASYLTSPDQLKPLLEGIERVVFNGDSVEMRFLEERAQAKEDLQKLKSVCSQAGVPAIFINGNHDPLVSGTNYVELVNGAVLVTHGDVLFHGLSPWSREADTLIEAHAKELDALDDLHDLEERLLATRKASLAIEDAGHKLRCTTGRSLKNFLYEFWPPLRPLRILTCWASTPRRAAKIAESYRPRAKFVILGHTHRGGIWRRGNRVIINTGSFLPLSGRLAVDVNHEIVVREIIPVRKEFRLGREVARFRASAHS
jgi:predicted phosphodiesterase